MTHLTSFFAGIGMIASFFFVAYGPPIFYSLIAFVIGAVIVSEVLGPPLQSYTSGVPVTGIFSMFIISAIVYYHEVFPVTYVLTLETLVFICFNLCWAPGYGYLVISDPGKIIADKNSEWEVSKLFIQAHFQERLF